LRILVTRPQPGGAATVARLQALGHEALLTPLLEMQATAWEAPEAASQAVMLTSAAAARLAGDAAAAFHGLPAFAVGQATAAAARAAGFADVRAGDAGVQALVMAMAADGFESVLHLAGEDRTAVAVPEGLSLVVRTVYRAELMPLPVLPHADWVLLYSARTAAHFAVEVDRLGGARGEIAIAAISAAVLAAAGSGWQRAIAAERPDEDAVLAAIGAAWQKPVTELE
jgi:uroporphyrinogen-III synthase